MREADVGPQAGGFDYVTVQSHVAPRALTVPVIHIPAPDLTVYDALRAERRHEPGGHGVGRQPNHRLAHAVCLDGGRARAGVALSSAEQQAALPLLLEVLELEGQERHERRITR